MNALTVTELVESNPLLRRLVLGDSESQSPEGDKKKKVTSWIPTPTHVLSHKIQKPKEELEEKKHAPAQPTSAQPDEGHSTKPFDTSAYSSQFRKGVILPPGVKNKHKERFRDMQARDMIEPFHIKMTYVMRTIEDLVNVLQMEDYLYSVQDYTHVFRRDEDPKIVKAISLLYEAQTTIEEVKRGRILWEACHK